MSLLTESLLKEPFFTECYITNRIEEFVTQMGRYEEAIRNKPVFVAALLRYSNLSLAEIAQEVGVPKNYVPKVKKALNEQLSSADLFKLFSIIPSQDLGRISTLNPTEKGKITKEPEKSSVKTKPCCRCHPFWEYPFLD
jgi:hypothetical protein